MPPLTVPKNPHKRATSTVILNPEGNPFLIASDQKSYNQQYSNIYFTRLHFLRKFVQERAAKLWKDLAGSPVLVPRVLEITKSQLCWVVGTVYMDMPLKPNVMVDIARDRSIPAPPPPKKIFSEDDNIMLEDESGRIRLVGERVTKTTLVTGVIIGVLGMETPSGEFEVVDMCTTGMAPQSRSEAVEEVDGMDVDGENVQSPLCSIDVGGAFTSSSTSSDEWIAVVSGLDIGQTSTSDPEIQMLVEYLTGEGGSPEDQLSASKISRLIIAGNVYAPILMEDEEGDDKKHRRYGYDSTSFSAHPTTTLSAHLLDLVQVMPVHILPGESDPSGTILPQQPFPRAMFGNVASYETFTCETNPISLQIVQGGHLSSMRRTVLVNSGQPLNDMYKYIPSLPSTRISLAESTLRWRHVAPTAPDTLWCHPYYDQDPFILKETPDVYLIGNQPRFRTTMVVADPDEGDQGGLKKKCRVVLVPRFAESGMLVLVNLKTLKVKTRCFAVMGMNEGDPTNGVKKYEEV